MTTRDNATYRDFDRLVRQARFQRAVSLGEALADGSVALARALSRTATQVQRSFAGSPASLARKRSVTRR